MNTSAGQATESVRSGAQALHDNHAFQLAARAGFAVNGVIHLVIAGIAVSVAAGSGGEADQGGALAQVASAPLGSAILWFIAAGLAALGLFQLVEVVLIRGTGKDAWADRAKEGGKGVAYLAIGASAATYAAGGSSDSSGQTQSLSAQLLSTPGGVVLLVVLGLAVAAIGVYFVVKGARKKFRDDIAPPAGTATKAATAMYPSEATGLDGALKSLAELPFGTVVLAVVAFGLAAFGLYCFIRARWPR
jgi:hypothetical protein